MRVVIDTNILVSALLNPHGIPAEVLKMLLEEKIVPCYDARILFEYSEVLKRPKFNFLKLEINALIDFITDYGFLAIPHNYPHKIQDPNDVQFFEVAIGSQAAYLITGNIAHFPRQIGKTKVVSPAQFVKNYFNSES